MRQKRHSGLPLPLFGCARRRAPRMSGATAGWRNPRGRYTRTTAKGWWHRGRPANNAPVLVLPLWPPRPPAVAAPHRGRSSRSGPLRSSALIDPPATPRLPGSLSWITRHTIGCLVIHDLQNSVQRAGGAGTKPRCLSHHVRRERPPRSHQGCSIGLSGPVTVHSPFCECF